MKKFFAAILVLFAFTSCSAENDKNLDSSRVLTPDEAHSRLEKIITTFLTRYHYKRTALNDSLSTVIYDNYLKTIDNQKLYFLQSDIDKFNKYRQELDDDLYQGNLGPAYEIFNCFKARMGQRTSYIMKLLSGGEFDYNSNESFEADREKSPYAKSDQELNDIWRKRLKNDALNLKLAGKDWKSISETLTKRYRSYQKAILQYESEDIFQTYMNSFANSVDPHSDYFSPKSGDDFKINMSLSLEGIGAQLRNDNDYTTVVEVIPGGPAFKSGLVQADDKIVGVAQGEKGEMVDVIGWRIDDVVQLIRGKKGTLVRLMIQKAKSSPSTAPQEIRLVRDKVKLEEQASKKEMINIEEQGKNYRIGVIHVPAFYIDFEARQRGEKDYKSTTRDVKKLILELKKEGAEGICIDLRNNGGGSLQEAVELAGLFIKDGPVVQVRNSDGSIEVDDDPDPSLVYSGPLSVIVNRFSASASEIFAGAIQDYGRGLIIGEGTYGKGTVQNVIDLKRFLPRTEDRVGQLKLTIAKYYRITGSSTQLKGVSPDIAFPSIFEPGEYGESSEKSALSWDQINGTKFNYYGGFSRVIDRLREIHQQRIKQNLEFKFLFEDIRQYRENKQKKEYSLNLEVRKNEKDRDEKTKKDREAERKLIPAINFTNFEGKTKNLRTEDPWLEESVRILSDYIGLSHSRK